MTSGSPALLQRDNPLSKCADVSFEGHGYDRIGSMTHDLTRRYGFTAMCTRKSDGTVEATLTRRSPGLQPMEPGRPPATMTLPDDERSAQRLDPMSSRPAESALSSSTARS
jgi:hypothetical protein